MAACTRALDENNTYVVSIVRSNGDLSSEQERIVVGDPLEQTASCNCEQFTRTSVLCGHALKVLDLMNINYCPSLHSEALDKGSKHEENGGGEQTQESMDNAHNDHNTLVFTSFTDLIMRSPQIKNGRVLLLGEGGTLFVWDPITGEERKVPSPRFPLQCTLSLTWTTAVLCFSAGTAGCNHLDCHHGPFIVVVVRSILFCTYSSDTAAWSEPTRGQGPGYLRGFVDPGMRSVVVGNALYFGIMKERAALKYNMQLRQMSWIQLPSSVPLRRQILLATTEDGGLGLATQHESKLYIWSRKDADEVNARWEQSRVIELKMLLPVDAADFTSPLNVVGSTDDLGTIFMRAGNVVYAADLKNYKGKKVCEGKINTIVPYMSFYTTALEAYGTGEGPSAGGSSA
ncbi:uncharacterized protein [Miscanthus floridulus]|uniref:uncharacterized protein n=1 Tax=Miscanthus floridulus TaxID=154761 RepID=UPI003458BB7D